MHSSQQPAASSQPLNVSMPKRVTSQRLVIVILAALCAACTTLGGEPRIVSTIPPATPTATMAPDRGEPAAVPDLANGARIYAANCAACHGETGQGDGPVALDTEGMEPRDFTDPARAREQTPHEWFRTITNGNIDKLMPPWRNVLTEQERWDVALYTYTMHYDAEALAIGERIFQDCAECHGPEGRGDGPEAADLTHEVKDLTDQSAMITLSDGSIFDMVTQGFEDVMPSYHELPDEDRWAVTGYARTLSLANNPWLTGADAPPAAETTAAMTAITGTALLVQIHAAGDGLDVVQALRVRNTSETLAFSQDIVLPDGQIASLGLTLPDGAVLTASSGIGGLSEDGRTAYVIEPLPPLSEQLYVLNYTLPYTTGETVRIPLDVVIAGPVRVLVRPLEMRVRGELLPGFGEQTLGSELYNAYGDQLALQSGTVLAFTLEGTPDDTAILTGTTTPAIAPPANEDRGGVSPDVAVPLAILAVILTAGGIIYAVWRRRQTPEARIMQIAREIGRIDAAHKAGTLNHDLWHRQRAALKEEQLTLRGYPPEGTKKDGQ